MEDEGAEPHASDPPREECIPGAQGWQVFLPGGTWVTVPVAFAIAPVTSLSLRFVRFRAEGDWVLSGFVRFDFMVRGAPQPPRPGGLRGLLRGSGSPSGLPPLGAGASGARRRRHTRAPPSRRRLRSGVSGASAQPARRLRLSPG